MLLPAADAVVVRGGASRDPNALLAKIEDAVADGDGAVLSVFCAERDDREREACIMKACVEGDIPHTQILVTSAGTLRSAGFDLEPESSGGQADCHYHVQFGNDVTIDRVKVFVGCFHGPIPNPTGGKRRKDAP